MTHGSSKQHPDDRLTAEAFAAEHGLAFRDPALLVQALTHRSYINETLTPDTGDNERLEFLGDALLNFIVGDWLFRQFPDAPEGQLTRLRAALVRKETLADLARRLRIGAALRIGRGDEKGGGRERSSTLSDALEAVIGALFVDQGLEAVRAFLMPLLSEALDAILQSQLDRDPRSDLQERVQARYNLTPTYRYSEPTGPDHQRQFTVDVLIGERVIASGSGYSKQAAAMEAARHALAALDNPGAE
ncbi:MAG: ribonuclease III [Candidatus Flexifilum sp.]